MSQDLHELEQRISQLNDADKTHLLLFLLESIESADSGNIDEAWRIEAEARLGAVEGGNTLTVPIDEAFTSLGRRFR